MGKKPADSEPFLFELPPKNPKKILIKKIREPIWTQHKARLIHQYLYLFVQVTGNGCYIDGFAGPQEPGKPEMWAANLVLGIKLLKQFHFFECDRPGIRALEVLRDSNPHGKILIYPGDFNEEIVQFLKSGKIGLKEATFCLLDQRTFECEWKTVQTLAAHKSGYKIELFYLFANQWLGRAFSALTKNITTANKWWGNEGWRDLPKTRSSDRVKLMVERFKELGYNHVMAWPIHEKDEHGGHLMYWMIHSTDHPAAPNLMRRAYDKAVGPRDMSAQIPLEL